MALLMDIFCPVWTDHRAALHQEGALSFYIDSPRAGGMYEFHLPTLGVDLVNPKFMDAWQKEDAGKWIPHKELRGTPDGLYYGHMCDKMHKFMRDCKVNMYAKLFELLLSREIYASKEKFYEINLSDLRRIAKTEDARLGSGVWGTEQERAEFFAGYLASEDALAHGNSDWLTFDSENSNKAMAASYCLEFNWLVEAAEWLAWKEFIKIRKHGAVFAVKILPSLLDTYATPKFSGAGHECFVAMSFAKTEKLEALYRAIQLGAGRAGYRAVRVDRIEHINKIDDEIIARIRQAKFVVADLTKQNQGVYYEAGFAHGENRKIIYTCEESDIKNVHFDINHYNILPWNEGQLKDDGKENLARRLQNRIEAVFGKGNYKPKG